MAVECAAKTEIRSSETSRQHNHKIVTNTRGSNRGWALNQRFWGQTEAQGMDSNRMFRMFKGSKFEDRTAQGQCFRLVLEPAIASEGEIKEALPKRVLLAQPSPDNTSGGEESASEEVCTAVTTVTNQPPEPSNKKKMNSKTNKMS